jgi:hypothetical protein
MVPELSLDVDDFVAVTSFLHGRVGTIVHEVASLSLLVNREHLVVRAFISEYGVRLFMYSAHATSNYPAWIIELLFPPDHRQVADETPLQALLHGGVG